MKGPVRGSSPAEEPALPARSGEPGPTAGSPGQAADIPGPAVPTGSPAALPRLLLSMLPGLIPLFVFVGVSEIWGDMVGVWAGVGMGVGEFLFLLVVRRRLDAFVLVDTALLAAMGLVSALLDNAVFFRLKPAVMELVLVVILGFSAFGPRDFLTGMALKGEAARQMRENIATRPEASAMMRSLLAGLFWVLLAHTALAAASAWMSVEAWGFITGVLPLLLMVLMSAVWILKTRLPAKRKQSSPPNTPHTPS